MARRSAIGRRYGWKRDLPDPRDFQFKPKLRWWRSLPDRMDLRERFPVPCYDQGSLGSCTGNAIAAAVQYARQQAGAAPDFVPSRLFIYFNERKMEGTILEDSGAMIRDGIKSIAKHGVCPERSDPPAPHDWPYDVDKFMSYPPVDAYRFGEDHQAIRYERLPNVLRSLKACLASGYPFVFGFAVFDSFESAEVRRTGVVPMPGRDEASLGGHAVLAVGYDDATEHFIVRNSWGDGWGAGGHFYMPYEYLTGGLSADMWTISKLEA